MSFVKVIHMSSSVASSPRTGGAARGEVGGGSDDLVRLMKTITDQLNSRLSTYEALAALIKDSAKLAKKERDNKLSRIAYDKWRAGKS